MLKEQLVNRRVLCLTICGIGHFVIDFICALTVVSLSLGYPLADTSFSLIIFYNLLAFGSQPVFGWFIDRSTTFREGMIGGLILVTLGAFVSAIHPVASVIFLGIGNALFHVGGGAVVFCSSQGRAGGLGLFIAPGGLGLLGGIALASQEIINPVWMTPLPFIVATIIHCIPQQLSDLKWLNTKREQVHLLPAVLSLLLFIVTVRSFCGFAFVGPWKLTGNSLLLLALASFLGKALGGFLGDQIGWRTFSGTILTLAAVACGFGYDVNLVAAFVAVFCIQATTGITLAGIQALFPGRPAFAFGIPCLALLVGAIPILFSFQLSFFSSKNAAMACFCAAIAGSYAFTIFKKRRG